MKDEATAPALAGLIVGIAFVVILSFWVSDNNPGFSTEKPPHVTVIIPKGSSMESSERNNFEPAVIKVVIDVNNTVRWVNEDVFSSRIVAADEKDPEFWSITSDDNARLLMQGDTFEFTFTIPGEFEYHSVPHPHKRGTVVVLEPQV